MHLANAQYAYLFFVVPVFVVFYWWSFRRRRKALLRFAEAPLVEELIRGVGRAKQKLKAVLFLVFLVFAVLASLRPQWGSKLETVRRTGVDMVIALDTSLSMDTQDVVPGRLDKAKHEVRALIDAL